MRSRAIVVCLGAWAAACAPRGDPPAGRQLVTDRTSIPIGVVRSDGDGIIRVLVTRPDPDGKTIDLHVVSVDATGAPPVDRLLVAGLPAGFNINCQPGPYACTDARGRLLVDLGNDSTARYNQLARIDPFTGARIDFGAVFFHALSPSGERLVISSDPTSGSATLYDADDRVIPLDASSNGIYFTFVGEILYYLSSQQELMRLAVGGSPELVATDISLFTYWPQQTTGDPLLELGRPTADPRTPALSILDTVTGNETPLPAGTTLHGFTLSPDGRWIATFDGTPNGVTFTDWSEGLADASPTDVTADTLSWRPGHDEIWMSTGQVQDSEPSFWINKPGADPLEVSGFLSPLSDDAGQYTTFTADGTAWFSLKDPLADHPVVQVGLGDDPTGPRFDLAPAGATVAQYWELADRRILVPAFTTTATRSDIYAVDPATGQTQVLGEEGAVMAVGRTRSLVNQHILDNEGDLTVFDLATARSTVLALEFTLGAFVEPVGADPVAPGAHVAFQFQARFPSPYDGIWLATVP
jgi:hypothetical protein